MTLKEVVVLGEGDRVRDRRPATITERARSRVLGLGEAGNGTWVGESLPLLGEDSAG